MEGTVIISLKRFKELEKYEQAVNEKKAVCVESFGIYGASYIRLIETSEATEKLIEHNDKQRKQIDALTAKQKKSWW